MTDSSNARRMRQLFEEAWTDGDLEVIDEIVADGFVFTRGGEIQTGGPELYKSLIRTTREMFPDMEYRVDDVIVGDGGDAVTVRWTVTATHEGGYKGVEPTNQTIEMEGLELNKFEDGRLVETCTYPHWVGFLEDVGVLPLTDSPETNT
ncbi:ester cyclase [Halorubrum sp. FL23]|uniref:ester cyclase n=1 Tax=Halorubrum sp. FL23 TaxID=3458704 RepID=UPI004034DE49